MEAKLKRRISVIIIISIFILWTIFVYYLSPEKIVEKIGIENSYLLAFTVAFIGGTSIFFPIPYYLLVFTLGAGGLNPIILGLSSASGVLLGDSTSYFLGYTGREIISEKLKKLLEKLYNWCITRKPYLLPIIFFLYGTFIPLPNDVITVSMGMAHYPYKKVIIPLGLGNIIFNITLALAGFYGWKIL